MKKYLILLMSAALFVGCANDDDPTVTPTKEVVAQFKVSTEATTRTITQDEGEGYKTQFVAGDIIGIHKVKGSVMSGNAVYDPMNVKYKVSADGTSLQTDETPITLGSETGYTLVAYFPYKTPYNPAAELKKFSVKEDQSTRENFENSNFLNSSVKDATNANPNIEFVFTQRTALVQVRLIGAEAANVSEVAIRVVPTGKMVFTQYGPAAGVEGDPTDIKMYKQKTLDNEVIYTAFAPEQTIAAGETLVKVTLGSETKEWKPSDAIKFTTGHVTPIALNF